jgi:hypothetical protein
MSVTFDLPEDARKSLQYTPVSAEKTPDDPEEQRSEQISEDHWPLDSRYATGSPEHPHEFQSHEA